jgi:hypothetical protein
MRRVRRQRNHEDLEFEVILAEGEEAVSIEAIEDKKSLNLFTWTMRNRRNVILNVLPDWITKEFIAIKLLYEGLPAALYPRRLLLAVSVECLRPLEGNLAVREGSL